MDSPACGIGYCEDCGIDCGVRDRDDDAAIETLRAMLMEQAARMVGEVGAARQVKRAAPSYYDGWIPGHERRACIAIALALLL